MATFAAVLEARASTSQLVVYQFHCVRSTFAACHSPDWVCGLFGFDFKLPPIGHFDELAATTVKSDRTFKFFDSVGTLGNVRIHFVLAVIEQIDMIGSCIVPLGSFLEKVHASLLIIPMRVTT